MKRIDYKKEMNFLYAPSAKEISIVDVPSMNYLMIDGKGDPNTAKEYSEVVEALYAVAYTIKFIIKKGEQQIDYGVMPLEGLWWVPDMRYFSVERKDDWLWTAMIMQPEIVTKEIVVEAIESVREKKNPPALEKLRFDSFNEGKGAQILYFGPYRNEGPTIERLHKSIAERGYKRNGKHHEIYLNDPRKTAPERLKTIIRQPMN
ncbi:MAG: GyrI-like domain-containing protein [Ignavibacteriales bacterium]|nr:GyrI-like domain-containing protein [Ignavibacteriales bacterium]